MKRLIISLVGGVAGIVALLAGLGIDAWLHAEDETLAAREGIFTLTNPGHALLALGIALACGGIFSALHAAWGMVNAKGMLGRASVRHGTLGAWVVASMGAVVFALAVSSSGHAHGGESVHAHDASHGHVAADAAVRAGTDAAPIGMGAELANATDIAAGSSALDGDGVESAEHVHADVATTSIEESASGEMHAALAAPAVANVEPDGSHTHADAGVMAGASTMGDDASTDAETMDALAGSHPHETQVPTVDETACMAWLTEETRAATARFADYGVALAEGYVQNPGKVGANHYPNRAYTLDGKIMELSQPETLIYKTDAAGDRTLVGVMFKAAKGQPGPTPCGAASHWHTHTNCVDPATRAQTDETAPGICPAGYALRESGEMIHIWFAGPGQRKSA